MTDILNPPADINLATLEELIDVNGIGPNLASKIIEQRPYDDIHDLVQIPGINERKLAALLPYLTITKKAAKSKVPQKAPNLLDTPDESPVSKVGGTEAFVFLEDKNERQDALLMVFCGFIIGLLLILLRRNRQ
jgi:hypothetical protein